MNIPTAADWSDVETTPSTNLVCTATQGNGAALPSTLVTFNAATLTFGPGTTTPIGTFEAN